MLPARICPSPSEATKVMENRRLRLEHLLVHEVDHILHSTVTYTHGSKAPSNLRYCLAYSMVMEALTVLPPHNQQEEAPDLQEVVSDGSLIANGSLINGGRSHEP